MPPDITDERPVSASSHSTIPVVTIGELILIKSIAVPEPAELVAVMVTLEIPTEVGVPAISPVPQLIDSPGGRPVAEKLTGPLLAVI